MSKPAYITLSRKDAIFIRDLLGGLNSDQAALAITNSQNYSKLTYERAQVIYDDLYWRLHARVTAKCLK